ncbi:MAG TPA: GNAT family N-acetyltransferase [Gemmatimonadaceae bacterium]|nr:GNAT family N-acetyltransferase [Gemmatimonadaceae bacterium]
MNRSASALAQLDLSIDCSIRIRESTRRDLRDLEWYGIFWSQRALIEEAWERHRRGENLMLLAEYHGFPIGQVWVDLARGRTHCVGLLWALRVFPLFQGHGLGTALVAAAERCLLERDVELAEIGVEKNNPDARRLYERLGYHVTGDNRQVSHYTTPDGRRRRMRISEWILRKALSDASIVRVAGGDRALRMAAAS